MKRRRRCGMWGVMVIACICFAFPSVSGAVILAPVNLQYMTQQADRIFLGKVLQVEDDFDEGGLWSQFVTFEIMEVYKGDLGPTLTIKQVSPNAAPGTDTVGLVNLLAGALPHYQEGQEVVVFLSPDSEIGFTTTIGLMQGTFYVMKDARGEDIVVNTLQNHGLFKGLSMAALHKSQGLSGDRLQALQERPASFGLQNMKAMVKGFLIKE